MTMQSAGRRTLRRLRASLATIWRIQGETAPLAETAHRVEGLHEALLSRVLGLGHVAGDEVRRSECDPLVCLHELSIGALVALLARSTSSDSGSGRPSTCPLLHLWECESSLLGVGLTTDPSGRVSPCLAPDALLPRRRCGGRGARLLHRPAERTPSPPRDARPRASLARHGARRGASSSNTSPPTPAGCIDRARRKGRVDDQLDDATLVDKGGVDRLPRSRRPEGQININAENGVVFPCADRSSSRSSSSSLEERVRKVRGVRGVQNLLHTASESPRASRGAAAFPSTLGVADLARAREFYEAVGWTSGAAPADDVVFFQAGCMIVALWGRSQLAEDSCVEDTGGWGGITAAYSTLAGGGRHRPRGGRTRGAAIPRRGASETFWAATRAFSSIPTGTRGKSPTTPIGRLPDDRLSSSV